MVVALPWEVTPTFAVGAGRSALGAGRQAWIGEAADLDDALGALRAESGAKPELVAVDLYPGDPARRWAARNGLPARAVVRHHALVAAVMAAHRLGPDEHVIGFAFDRGGYGPDGATWGGEVLAAGYKEFRRVAHLDYVRTAGRAHHAALAHLRHAGVAWDLDLPPVRACATRERRVLDGQLDSGYGCGATSSLGLLLDAVAALHGPTSGHGAFDPYPMRGLDPGDLVRAVVGDVRRGTSAETIAARVRATVATLVARQARRCADDMGLDVVVLAGAVFDDPALTAAVHGALRGFTVLTGRPPLVLGQLLCAAAG
ncbi:hypothetical protein Ais01nite_71030 [Asanoa ishikariensis]|uniref:Kae1-like domain-containing protein n=1 Tax=Asanoa ishikariensis TaxID=137265 RepID=UPI0015A43C9D|nr:hypothetical protein [Asanoa ishikariensis]GIF69068.1 hypothetical protein Ais01nite_71030 [Asanoa ishikariensis]